MNIQNTREKKFHTNMHIFTKKKAKRLIKQSKNRIHLQHIKRYLNKNFKNRNYETCRLYHVNRNFLPNLNDFFIDTLNIELSHLQKITKNILPLSLKSVTINKLDLSFNCFEKLTFLRELSLYHTSCINISFFPNTLLSLEIINTNLSIDDINDLSHLQNLIFLILQNNNIKHIAFLNLPRLKKLNLAHNQIIIDHQFTHAISQLPRLHYMNLSNNQLKTFPYIRSLSLKCLVLKDNNISDINETTVQKNLPCLLEINLCNNNMAQVRFLGSKLEHLNLSNNKINFICIVSLNKYVNLIHLDLSENQLDEFPYMHSSSLGKLNLSNNKIRYIDEKKVAHHLPNLFFVNLSFNSLEKTFFLGVKIEDFFLKKNSGIKIILDSINKYKKLQTLHLSMNQLNKFPNLKLTCLTTIELNFNNIHAINEDEVQNHLPNLINVNLSNNQLKKIPFLGEKIKKLELANNEISAYDPFIFHQYKNLQLLYIQGNNGQTDKGLLFFFHIPRQYQEDTSTFCRTNKQTQYHVFLAAVKHKQMCTQNPQFVFRDNHGFME